MSFSGKALLGLMLSITTEQKPSTWWTRTDEMRNGFPAPAGDVPPPQGDWLLLQLPHLEQCVLVMSGMPFTGSGTDGCPSLSVQEKPARFPRCLSRSVCTCELFEVKLFIMHCFFHLIFDSVSAPAEIALSNYLKSHAVHHVDGH